jgi:pimeloyl-ACP methyl ester carboxylesterase
MMGSLYACGSNSGGSSSSNNTPPPAPPAAGDLVAAKRVATLDVNFLNAAILTTGLAGVSASGGTTCYKLTYRTPDVSGGLIDASGLVCLPAPKSGGNPVISYQHGTIFQDSEAPSSLGLGTSGEGLLGAVLGGLGYIAVLPDYVGYGDSTNELHPYVHAATLASATVNMNRAVRKFIADPAIGAATNGQLFLTGYSEGGYATLATQRLMQQSLAGEFSVTASEAGAGPYDMTRTTQTLLELPNQHQPAYAGFVLKAYDSIYNTPSQLTHYFSATYADAVNSHFDGSFSRDQISSALGGADVATSTLLNQEFITNYLGSGEAALKAHIAENDIYDWAPAVPTRLFHGRDDDVVPYANTTTAKTTMDRNGSTSVTVVDCNAGASPTTHDNCARPFAIDMISFFKSQAAGL